MSVHNLSTSSDCSGLFWTVKYLASCRDEIKAFASGTTVDIHRNGNDLQLDINEGPVAFLFFL